MAGSNPFNNRKHRISNPYRINPEDVESYTLADYKLTADELKLHHFGVTITDPNSGDELTDYFYDYVIESAVAQVEKRLDIAILPRLEVEPHDYRRNHFESYMFIHTKMKPIIQVEEYYISVVNEQKNFIPNIEWMKVNPRFGHISIMPSLYLSHGSNNGIDGAMFGVPAFAGVPHSFGNSNQAPHMFYVHYIAGMLPQGRRGVPREWEMHPDLHQVIMKIAQKEIMQQFGRLIIGAGIADMTIDVDGIRQSIGTTQSAMYGGASADILQLNEDIDKLFSQLQAYYGFNLEII